jgi:hypothetical protein
MFFKCVVGALINDSVSLHDKLAEISGKMAMPEIPETIPEKVIVSVRPVFPAGYVPWLNLTITEEVIA